VELFISSSTTVSSQRTLICSKNIVYIYASLEIPQLLAAVQIL